MSRSPGPEPDWGAQIAESVRENKPIPTQDGEYWQPMEVFNLRARYPETCWEPWLSQVCALPAGHEGYHGWSTRLAAQRPALTDG